MDLSMSTQEKKTKTKTKLVWCNSRVVKKEDSNFSYSIFARKIQILTQQTKVLTATSVKDCTKITLLLKQEPLPHLTLF